MASNVGLKSKWFSRDSLCELYRLVKEGDLLEFDRKLFQHWAVCVKVDGEATTVIHRTAGSSTTHQLIMASHSLDKMRHGVGTIDQQLLSEVVGDDKFRINNSRDKRKDPFPADTIIERAKMYWQNIDLVGEYHVLRNNCEHFATLCRNGKKRSKQATLGFDATGAQGDNAGTLEMLEDDESTDDDSTGDGPTVDGPIAD